MGSPMTFIIRPNVAFPTGTIMGDPVSPTLCPRTNPSVLSIAMVLTLLSPKCCATSSTSRLVCPSTSRALRTGGMGRESN